MEKLRLRLRGDRPHDPHRAQYAHPSDLYGLYVHIPDGLAGELINTAIENVVDLVEQKKNDFCKIAKDAAAGAVLVNALFAVAVGIAVLYQPPAFRALFDYYRTHPVMIAVLALSIAASLLFIFLPNRKKG